MIRRFETAAGLNKGMRGKIAGHFMELRLKLPHR
jgi:hypothetical protein